MHKSSKKAFTLVELLVVIGIIALLISILLPALSGARKAANRTKDLSNIRSFTQACVIYTAEFKGWWPVGEKDSGLPPNTYIDELTQQNYLSLCHLRKTYTRRTELGCQTLFSSAATVARWGFPTSISSGPNFPSGVDANGFLKNPAEQSMVSYGTTGWCYYGGRRFQPHDFNAAAGQPGIAVSDGNGVDKSPRELYVFPKRLSDKCTTKTLATCMWYSSGTSNAYGLITHSGKDSGGYRLAITPLTPLSAIQATKCPGICMSYTDGSARWVTVGDMGFMHDLASHQNLQLRFNAYDKTAK